MIPNIISTITKNNQLRIDISNLKLEHGDFKLCFSLVYSIISIDGAEILKQVGRYYELKTKNNVGTATSNVYVVPSSTTTVVIGVTLANTSGSSINVGLGITRASTDDISLMKNVPLPYGSSLEFMQGNKIVLESTDTLTAVSDTNSTLDVALTIMEIT